MTLKRGQWSYTENQRVKVNYKLSTILLILDIISEMLETGAGEELTVWMGVHPFLSVVLICTYTEEWLTSWMGVQVHPLLSVVLICSNTEEQLTRWMCVQPFSSVVLICLNTGEWTHSLDSSAILVSASNLLKHLRATHSLDACLTILVSGSDLLEHRRETHKLDANVCSILISSSDLLNCWRTTHKLYVHSVIFVSGSYLL